MTSANYERIAIAVALCFFVLAAAFFVAGLCTRGRAQDDDGEGSE
jgi:hypothetical protein